MSQHCPCCPGECAHCDDGIILVEAEGARRYTRATCGKCGGQFKCPGVEPAAQLRECEMERDMASGIIIECMEALATQPCLHETGAHKNTPPMMMKELIGCVLAKAKQPPAFKPTEAELELVTRLSESDHDEHCGGGLFRSCKSGPCRAARDFVSRMGGTQ